MQEIFITQNKQISGIKKALFNKTIKSKDMLIEDKKHAFVH